MRDGTPPRGGRGGRGGNPGGSSFRGARPAAPPRGLNDDSQHGNAFRPYGESSGRMPAQRAPGYGPTAGRLGAAGAGSWTHAELTAVHRRHVGGAIFHDGNPGHLWRGEMASQLGESTLSAGVIMWVALLLRTPLAVAAAVLALALPAVLMPLFSARLENLRDPHGPLQWIGRLRILLTLGLIAMHFHTIVAVLYGLLFGISLLSRLRGAARTAAFHTSLEPGEPAHVANDTHVGTVIAAVAGPLLATLFFIVLGERILLVSVGVAVFFLLSLNSDGFLDVLPEQKRAFLLATPEMAVAEGTSPDPSLDELTDDEDADPEALRELGLPEWYQLGPKNAWQAFADLRAGLGLAGTRRPATQALLAVAALALIGGGFAVLEVFYITGELGLPTFYLGPLLAAEAAGVALGMALVTTGKRWQPQLVGGTVVAGVALIALTRLPLMPLPLVVLLILGVATALAYSGARKALASGFTGVERRAIAAAERWVAAVCGVVGAGVFVLFLDGTFDGHRRLGATLSGWPIDVLLFLMGAGLALAGLLLVVVPAGPATKGKRGKRRKAKGKRGAANGRAGDAAGDGYDDADGSGYYPAASGEWDDESASAMQPAYGDTGYQTGYQTGYTEGAYSDTGYQTGYQTGYSETGYGDAAAARDDTGYGELNFGRASEYERGYTGEYDARDDDERGGPRGGSRGDPRGGRGGRR
ncbi:MAG: hypothetical protein ACHQ4H_00955 [Ktedonobacterales bacterium]